MGLSLAEMTRQVRPLLVSPKAHLIELSQLLTDPVERPQAVPWYVPNHYLAGRVVGIEDLWQEVAAAVAPLLADEETTCRRQAMHVLALAPSPHAVQGAIRVLGDSDWSVQTCAIDLLGDQRAYRAKTLIVPFLSHRLEDLRLHAVMSLGKLGYVELLDRFDELFRNDPQTAVQGWAGG